MARALIIQHHIEDRPGLVYDELKTRGFEIDVVMMDATSETPSVSGYDLLVILGSKHAVYDKEIETTWFGRELQVISDAERLDVPILGICFGAQALCLYHGGVVEPSSDPELGWFEILPENDSGVESGPWFEYHFDRCVLPPQAQLWASSANAVQAFAVGMNVGVQFHPEIEEAQLSDWFAAFGEDDAIGLGLDPASLLARTARETPASRGRVSALVDLVLTHGESVRTSGLGRAPRDGSKRKSDDARDPS
jgi:GMP synthase-like glutamine amidotransferase